MPRQRPQYGWKVGLYVGICLLVSLLGVAFASTHEEAFGPCEPKLVYAPPQPRLVLAAARPVDTATSAVRVEWLGHSSFLLTSPAGVRVLTDPNGFHPPATVPDLVTISNLHMTHSTMLRLPGTPQMLWGISPERGWNKIQQAVKDLILFNIPSYSSRLDPENSPIQNSIFLFRVAGVCIVHLGNLRHPLTPGQLQRLGRPDVLMIPVDGQWTLSYDEVMGVIEQLQPLLVIPMHIDFPQHAEVFVQATRGRYPVRRLTELSLPLNRRLLPATTEIVVFGSH